MEGQFDGGVVGWKLGGWGNGGEVGWMGGRMKGW